MMERLTLLLIAVFVGACATDNTLFEVDATSPSAKLTGSRDPFSGQDEESHVESIGASVETFRTYFKLVARRLAVAFHDKKARTVVLKAIAEASQEEANIAKLLVSRPELQKAVTDGFVKEAQGAFISNGQLIGIISKMNDADAFLAVCEALFGLELRLINGEGYQGETAISVFHDQIIDEKDAVRWDGFAPGWRSGNHAV